jgi:hypothetical protein
MLTTSSTLLFGTLAWVLFRAPDTEIALAVYGKLLFIDASGAAWYYHAALPTIGWAVLCHLGGSLWKRDGLVFSRTPYSHWAAFGVVVALLVIYVLAPLTVSPFIYFQF